MAPLYTVTASRPRPCDHNTGWYRVVPFWIFSRYLFVCSDCGDVFKADPRTHELIKRLS